MLKCILNRTMFTSQTLGHNNAWHAIKFTQVKLQNFPWIRGGGSVYRLMNTSSMFGIAFNNVTVQGARMSIGSSYSETLIPIGRHIGKCAHPFKFSLSMYCIHPLTGWVGYKSMPGPLKARSWIDSQNDTTTFSENVLLSANCRKAQIWFWVLQF